jgi:hypothetical protein
LIQNPTDIPAHPKPYSFRFIAEKSEYSGLSDRENTNPDMQQQMGIGVPLCRSPNPLVNPSENYIKLLWAGRSSPGSSSMVGGQTPRASLGACGPSACLGDRFAIPCTGSDPAEPLGIVECGDCPVQRPKGSPEANSTVPCATHASLCCLLRLRGGSRVPLFCRTNENRTVFLEIPSTEITVRELKKAIMAKVSCPDEFGLSFAGRRLEDECRLTDFGIQKSNTVQMVTSLCG